MWIYKRRENRINIFTKEEISDMKYVCSVHSIFNNLPYVSEKRIPVKPVSGKFVDVMLDARQCHLVMYVW